MTAEEARTAAVETITAVLRSVPRGTIPPRLWWDRARSALETAAGRSDSWARFVSTLAAKLQVHVLTADSAQAIARVGAPFLADPQAFALLRQVCGPQESVYVIALAQASREKTR